jgi:hypothetical protein
MLPPFRSLFHFKSVTEIQESVEPLLTVYLPRHANRITLIPTPTALTTIDQLLLTHFCLHTTTYFRKWFDFTATAITTTISFEGKNCGVNGGNRGMLLDSVKVYQQVRSRDPNGLLSPPPLHHTHSHSHSTIKLPFSLLRSTLYKISLPIMCGGLFDSRDDVHAVLSPQSGCARDTLPTICQHC